MIFMVERLTAETWTRSAVAGMPASLTRMRLIGGILIVGWSMVVPGALAENAAESASGGGDLTGFTLEQLVNVQVTSVSKRSESLSQASAAITVISQDDIQRSGARTIAEALRLSPGLSVAKVDSHTWAVSSRGFNDSFANKLLVLMDGRSVYTPLFSGVYWDVQDTMMEDIDRIEVIRGPGATLWGANAVNGVINVITKSAKDTQGGLAVAGGGNEELGFGSLRYGGKLSDKAYYRVYSKYDSRDASAMPDGGLADDRWQMARTGFRVDWEAAENSSLTFQGDAYGGREDQTYQLPTLTAPDFLEVKSYPIEMSGGNFLGRWKQDFSAESDMTLQLYYDRTRRDTQGVLTEDRDTVDVDWQHHWRLSERHYWIWGLGYRVSTDRLEGGFLTSFANEKRTSHLVSLFAQDEIELVRDRLHVVLGSKFEQNDYTGFEIQPGMRLSWTPDDRQTLWASVARAVRTPSRAEDGIRLNQSVSPGAPPTVFSVFGNSDYTSEDMLAYEVGYRAQVLENLSLDLATFYNVYDDLRTSEFRSAGLDPSLPGSPIAARLELDNRATGETFGGELAMNWRVRDWWRLRGSYTLLETQIHSKANSNDSDAEDDEGKSPHHQAALQSSLDLPGHVHFDLLGRYVDQLKELGVDGYFALDVRLAWRPTHNLEFSIVGQNLFDDRHREFVPTIIPIQRTETQRSIYGKISFGF